MPTKIQWAEETWNPVTGCDKVSPGCKHCYAELMSARLKAMGQKKYSNGFNLTFHADALSAPLHWKRPRMIFVNSMSDLFHEGLADEAIDQVFAVMALCPQHVFMVLTKRADQMRSWFRRTEWSVEVPDSCIEFEYSWSPEDGSFFESAHTGPIAWPLSNVWLGVSAENQKYANERWAHLRQCPAAVKFISYEPALGPLDIDEMRLAGIVHEPTRSNHPALPDWVIAGGESGPGARPSNPEWFRSVRDQCEAAGVPFFFKQWGEWREVNDRDTDQFIALRDGLGGVTYHRDGGGPSMIRVKKKVAGRLLDGRTWDQFPEVSRDI